MGNGFQLALCNRGWLTTQKFVILVPRSHRLRAVVGAARPRRALCDSCQDTPRVVVLCFLGPTPDHKSTGRAISWRQRSTGRSRSWRWEDSQKSRAEEHATNHDTTKLRRDDGGVPKRGALYGSHNAVLPYRVKVCFYCVTSLAVLSSGSTVGGKTDALVVALFQNCSFHGVCVVGFPLQTGHLIAAAVRKRRRRLGRVPEAIERCRCSWCS